MRQLLLVLTILFISSACSNFHMEKRRYNKGFHITFNKNRVKKESVKEEKLAKSKDFGSKKARILTAQSNPKATSAKTDSTIQFQAESNQSPKILASIVNEENTSPIIATNNAIERVTEISSVEIKSSESATKPTKREGMSGLWYFALLGILPVLLAAKKQTRSVGMWAAENVSKAQLSIAGLYAVGFSSSFLLGNIWQPIIEEWMLIVPLTIAGSILVADALKTKTKVSSTKKRMSLAAVNVSSFFGTFAMGAQTTIFQAINPESQSGMETWAAALTTILLVCAMVFAFLVIAMLACNLSCSGYGVLALIVFASGTFLTLFLGTWGILGAFRGKARNSDNINTALIVAIIPVLIILAITGIAAFL